MEVGLIVNSNAFLTWILESTVIAGLEMALALAHEHLFSWSMIMNP